mmetsp:Transcript_18695/g.47269  ORF Transcript_18695/g.47269 Transcript_18695/m.47269 type:complete len:87 (-) Transcript_18695:136-396(-)
MIQMSLHLSTFSSFCPPHLLILPQYFKNTDFFPAATVFKFDQESWTWNYNQSGERQKCVRGSSFANGTRNTKAKRKREARKARLSS